MLERLEPLKISAVITTYNRPKYLRTAVESVLSQTRKVDEVIVVDDGSSDEIAPKALKR